MRALILAPAIAGLIFWGLLSAATTSGGALTAATGLSGCVVMLVLVPAWRIARAGITRKGTA